jgi:hypothetical protein
MNKLYMSEEPIFFTPPQTRAERMAGAPQSLYKSAPKAPQPDPRMYEIMDQQVGLSREALDFVKQTTAQQAVRQQALDSLTSRIGESQLQDAATARERSNEQYQFFQTHGRPVLEKTMSDAQNYDSAGNIAAFRGRAVTDVNNAFASAEQQQARTLSRFGVMPNANRLASINAQRMAQKAASQAGAMTNSELGVRNQAIAMRQQASNLAQGMPATTMQFGQQAMQGNQAALGGAQAANNAQLQANQQAMSGYGQAGQIMGSAGQLGNQMHSNQINAWNAGNQAQAAESSGFGSLLGAGLGAFGSFAGSSAGSAALAAMMADGGEVGSEAGRVVNGQVRGPGTGTSDSIAAFNKDNGERIALSSGEFVIPESVVRRKGTEFFERLIEKNHTPSAMQRRQRGQ